MKHRIYRLSDTAQIYAMPWDYAICMGEIETVQEFESYADAVRAYENGGYDSDVYGVE